MFIEDYKKELDNITLSDDFKKQTVQLLLEKSKNIPHEAYNTAEKKTLIFPKRALINIVAACFAVAVAIWVINPIGYKTESASFDSALAENETDREARTTDDITNNSAELFRFYTVDDRKAIEAPGTAVGAAMLNKQKVSVTMDGSGGMGFESYLLKNPGELEQNSAYTVGDKFDSLPVYATNPLNTTELTRELEKALEKYNLDYLPFTYRWANPVYHESGEFMYSENIDTDSPIPPSNTCFLSRINTVFTDKNGTDGNISMNVGRNHLRVEYNRPFTDGKEDSAIIEGFTDENPDFFDDEYLPKTEFDYNIYGEVYNRTYMYKSHEDFGINLFNNTLNLTSFAQFDFNDEKSTIVDEYLPNCWKIQENLPAIDYAQALELLYNGVYYSSSPVEITDETKVSHIEMTYLNGYYDMRVERYTGYTLPFYKFYVDISDDFNPSRYEETGLRTYAAYYVCAIHPDYIEKTENSPYAVFNG